MFESQLAHSPRQSTAALGHSAHPPGSHSHISRSPSSEDFPAITALDKAGTEGRQWVFRGVVPTIERFPKEFLFIPSEVYSYFEGIFAKVGLPEKYINTLSQLIWAHCV